MSKGLIAGCFDPFPHPGQLLAMEEAMLCTDIDSIIVCLHVEPSIERPDKAKCVMSLVERKIMLDAIGCVSEIVCYETEGDLEILLHCLDYSVRILGADYAPKDGVPVTFTGCDLEKPVFFAQRYVGWSATDFRKRLTEGEFYPKGKK